MTIASFYHPEYLFLVEPIAKREDNEDVLFKLDDKRYAVVHQTYKKEDELQWPHTVICTWEESLNLEA